MKELSNTYYNSIKILARCQQENCPQYQSK